MRAGSGATRNRVAGETELTPVAAVKPRAERSNGFVSLRSMIVVEVISLGQLERRAWKPNSLKHALRTVIVLWTSYYVAYSNINFIK